MAIVWGKFSAKALDFIQNSNARLNILHGSVRSSKTVNVDVRWLTYLLDGPPGDLFMIGKTVATLQRNVLNDIFDLAGPKNYKWIDKQKGELRLFHRRIYVIGANNEESESKIRGATIAGAYCDEANLYPEVFFSQLMARMSIADAKCFITLNPDSPYHWFYTNYLMNDEIINKKVWHFTMDDNPNLDPEYVKTLKQMYTGVFYRRFILGEWCVADGMIYDMFDEKRHVKVLSPDEQLHVARYIIGCDYGTSTVMSWSKIAIMLDGSYHKVQEYYYDAVESRRQKTDKEFGDDFDLFIKDIPYGRLHAIYCDPSASSWKAELRSRQYRVQDADNDVINGIRFMGSELGKTNYTMDLSCVNSRREYSNYCWDEKAQVMGIDKPIKTNDHACDSDRYAIYTYGQNSKGGTY